MPRDLWGIPLWQLGTGTIPGPLIARHYFFYFSGSFWLWVVCLHMCADSYSNEHSRKFHCGYLEFSLYAALWPPGSFSAATSFIRGWDEFHNVIWNWLRSRMDSAYNHPILFIIPWRVMPGSGHLLNIVFVLVKQRDPLWVSLFFKGEP